VSNERNATYAYLLLQKKATRFAPRGSWGVWSGLVAFIPPYQLPQQAAVSAQRREQDIRRCANNKRLCAGDKQSADGINDSLSVLHVYSPFVKIS